MVFPATRPSAAKAADWIIQHAIGQGYAESIASTLARQTRRLLNSIVEVFETSQKGHQDVMISVDFDEKGAQVEVATEGVLSDLRFVTDEAILDSKWQAQRRLNCIDGLTTFRLAQAI